VLPVRKLPDAGVLLTPRVADVVGNVCEQAARVRVERVPLVHVHPGGVQQVAVSAELELVSGAVPIRTGREPR